jgi:hypothetical protein
MMATVAFNGASEKDLKMTSSLIRISGEGSVTVHDKEGAETLVAPDNQPDVREAVSFCALLFVCLCVFFFSIFSFCQTRHNHDFFFWFVCGF